MKKMCEWHGCPCRCTVVSRSPFKIRLGPGCKRVTQEQARRLEQMATVEEQEAALQKVR